MIVQRIIRKILCYYSIRFATDLYNKTISDKQILLTFDDGPHPVYTPILLDLLSIHNIKGLFFVLGENVLRYPEIVKRIHEDGHIIGNHSYFHKDVNQTSYKKYIQNYYKCEKIINEVIEFDTKHFFRPPRGVLTLKLLLHFLIHRVSILLWTVDSNDSKFSSTDDIVETITSLKKNKEIILFHDDSKLVIEVLERTSNIWNNKSIKLPKLR